jgi:hypothetical protein
MPLAAESLYEEVEVKNMKEAAEDIIKTLDVSIPSSSAKNMVEVSKEVGKKIGILKPALPVKITARVIKEVEEKLEFIKDSELEKAIEGKSKSQSSLGSSNIIKLASKIPSAIRGTKPGAIPNTEFLEREGETRRKTATASTALIRKNNASCGIGNFVVIPKSCNFGNLKNGGIYEMNMMLTNVGFDGTRFKIKKDQKSFISVEYKLGLVAPGITLYLKVRLDLREAGVREINDVIQIITESDILKVEVKASMYIAKYRSCGGYRV